MRKWLWVGLVALLASPSVWAGRPGGGMGGPGGGRCGGGFMGVVAPWPGFMQGQQTQDAFDIVRRTSPSPTSRRPASGSSRARPTRSSAAEVQLRTQLATKYAPLIGAVLPAADKE